MTQLEKVLSTMTMGELLGIVERELDAVDKSVARVALATLGRRFDVIQSLVTKCQNRNFDTAGILKADGRVVFSVGKMGAGDPEAAAVRDTLYEAVEAVERKLL